MAKIVNVDFTSSYRSIRIFEFMSERRLTNMCIYVCIIKIQVPREVKNQRAIAKMATRAKRFSLINQNKIIVE